jgi:hypothetical protein
MTTSTNRTHVTTRRRKTGARKSTEPELVGALEAATIVGVSQTNLRVLVGLPEPYQVLRSTTLWRKDDIEELAVRRAERAAK